LIYVLFIVHTMHFFMLLLSVWLLSDDGKVKVFLRAQRSHWIWLTRTLDCLGEPSILYLI